MNKIKTAELTGATLDWCVAKCERADSGVYAGVVWLGTKRPFNPSTSWQDGGPIKERERIDILYDGNEVVARKARMVMHPPENIMSYCAMRGHTELIAAMRCYVASRLGDEVEIPSEL